MLLEKMFVWGNEGYDRLGLMPSNYFQILILCKSIAYVRLLSTILSIIDPEFGCSFEDVETAGFVQILGVARDIFLTIEKKKMLILLKIEFYVISTISKKKAV